MTQTLDTHDVDRWWRRVRKEFSHVTKPLIGCNQPLCYVEIGVWGGAASEWVCQNILIHPESIGFGIDPYDQSQERRRHDVAAIMELAHKRMFTLMGNRYQWIREPSASGVLTLRSILGDRKIDLLYIDGLHEAPDVLNDFLLAWPMLKDGSIVIFDDYARLRNDYKYPHVRHACAAIEIAFRHRIKPIHLFRQYAMEVVRHSLPKHWERFHTPEVAYGNLALPHLTDKGDLVI